MKNKRKVRLIFIGLSVLGLILIVAIVWALVSQNMSHKKKVLKPPASHLVQSSRSSTSLSSSNKIESKSDSSFGASEETQLEILKFVDAYYNTSKVGDNETAVKPYVTSSIYNWIVNQNNDGGRGTKVSQKVTSASVFIDAKNALAIVQVTMTANYSASHGGKFDSSANQTVKNNLYLTYTKESNRYLVSKIQFLNIVGNSGSDN